MAQPASVLGDRGDPRLHEKERDFADSLEAREFREAREAHHGGIRPQHRALHDTSVTFEEYNYYAQLSRAEEDTYTDHDKERGWLSLLIPSKSDGAELKDAANINTSDKAVTATITDDEWTNASRALRTATRGAIFYLITTDILGPFGLPYAFGTMGWG